MCVLRSLPSCLLAKEGLTELARRGSRVWGMTSPPHHDPSRFPPPLPIKRWRSILSESDELPEQPQIEEDELKRLRTDLFQSGSSYLPVTREEIVGIDNVLSEIENVIHWLKYSKAYKRFNARLEPGVLLEGEAGTGKTMLARYIATSSNALFINVRDFPHNGAFLQDGDIADFFARARKSYETHHRPIILFWDEFEGGAKERSNGATVEQAAAVSQLTAELDGIHGKNEGVLLIGCTNYAYMIDDALLRPGRMGLHIEFNAPDRAGKEKLLAHYLEKIETIGEINLETLSYFFDESDPAAAVEEAVNEAWRVAVARSIRETEAKSKDIMKIKRSTLGVAEEDLINVFLSRLIGPPPTFINLVNDNLFSVAVHETGHALAALVWDIPLRLVTVRPGKHALGKTFLAKTNEYTGTVLEDLCQLRVGAAGLIAEEVTGVGRGVGSHGDTSGITTIASHLVDVQGIGQLSGLMNPNGLEDRYHVGPSWSEWMLRQKDQDLMSTLKNAEEDCREAFTAIGGEDIRDIAQKLVETETMTGAQFTEVCLNLIGNPTNYRP